MKPGRSQAVLMALLYKAKEKRLAKLAEAGKERGDPDGKKPVIGRADQIAGKEKRNP